MRSCASNEACIDECFSLMGLKRGVDFASVKNAYRRLLKRCHPDKFHNRPHLIPVAERKTKHLVEIYSALEGWYQSNGGIDPCPDSGLEAQRRQPFVHPSESPSTEKPAASAPPPPSSPLRARPTVSNPSDVAVGYLVITAVVYGLMAGWIWPAVLRLRHEVQQAWSAVVTASDWTAHHWVCAAFSAVGTLFLLLIILGLCAPASLRKPARRQCHSKKAFKRARSRTN